MKKRKQTRGKINAAKDVANEFAPNRRKHILENLELPAEKNIYEAKKTRVPSQCFERRTWLTLLSTQLPQLL